MTTHTMHMLGKHDDYEVYKCFECGYLIWLRWPPEYHKITIVPAPDPDIEHTGRKTEITSIELFIDDVNIFELDDIDESIGGGTVDAYPMSWDDVPKVFRDYLESLE